MTVRVRQAFETTRQDVRYALRTFRRSPGFVLTVAATIALGLGINMALFTLFNAYVLRRLNLLVPSLTLVDRFHGLLRRDRCSVVGQRFAVATA